MSPELNGGYKSWEETKIECVIMHGILNLGIYDQVYRLDGAFLGTAMRYADARHLPSHNMPMIHADVIGESEQRYRNCLTIGCGKSFKFAHADDWTCPDCKAQRAEIKRRQCVEGVLLDANARVKA